MMGTHMNFPGFYFFIAHRYTLKFFDLCEENNE